MTSLVSFISKDIEKYISYKLSYRKILYLFNIDIYLYFGTIFWNFFCPNYTPGGRVPPGKIGTILWSELYPWGAVYPQGRELFDVENAPPRRGLWGANFT